jgi:ATP-dependent DNA helicase RecQ
MKTRALVILNQVWGYDTFKANQWEVINSILEKKDTLAILPTGGGKSICYQIPGLMMEGLSLVISPLISLMDDQEQQLKKRGIPCAVMSSFYDYKANQRIADNAGSGAYKFLFISPERLRSKIFLEQHLPFFNINQIVVDEAHCISQWGYDFRPSYLEIASIREMFIDVPILALTASATIKVQEDIKKNLLFDYSNTNTISQSIDRPNINFNILEKDNKLEYLTTLLKNLEGTGIIYLRNRRATVEYAELFKNEGIKIEAYHAGMSPKERETIQSQWIDNKIRIICATNAFGMGIDKPDVRFVIHIGIPPSLEEYYQEVGRAGRDGKSSSAYLIYNQSDVKLLIENFETTNPTLNEIKEFYDVLAKYLNIPLDQFTDGQMTDFDLVHFCNLNNISFQGALNAFQVLESNSLINFNQNPTKQSSLKILANEGELIQLYSENKDDEILIKTILRLYGGIFDLPIKVDEGLISRMSKLKTDWIVGRLSFLNQMEVVSYKPVTKSTQIGFIEQRYSKSELSLDYKTYQTRLVNNKIRLEAMLNFINLPDHCKGQTISNYFGQFTNLDCGHCDYCLSSNKSKEMDVTFEQIQSQILKLLKTNALGLLEIKEELSLIQMEEISHCLQNLMDDEVVSINKQLKYHII